MAQVSVYKNGILIYNKLFDSQFYIFKDMNGGLFWQTFDERRNAPKGKTPGGTYQIWIQNVGGDHAIIKLIDTNWHIVIDNEELPQECYSDVPVSGKEIILKQSEYVFEFVFEGHKQNIDIKNFILR
jgi:hypothetical protein